jgi:two-component system, chemotaxis family, protein-glutamate methylesterase/glutaminase
VVVRTLFRMTLASSTAIELVGVANDGVQGLEMIRQLRPEVVILGIEMPRMDGLRMLTELRKTSALPRVIVCSIPTGRGAVATLDALSRGADDYVAKPAQKDMQHSVAELSATLIPKILALAARQSASPPAFTAAAQAGLENVRSSIVVLGVSTGGPIALHQLIPALPASFPLPILVVQHMPQYFTAMLAERLNSVSALRVREAEQDAKLEPGVVWIAKGDWHLEIRPDLRLALTQSKPEQFCRPSVDVLFRSAVRLFGAETLGVVLTGMGCDGLNGCHAIRAAGGYVLAQDEASSIVWGMPGAVIHAGLANRVLALDRMAPELARLLPAPRAQQLAASGWPI